jgi:hypothetical protein
MILKGLTHGTQIDVDRKAKVEAAILEKVSARRSELEAEMPKLEGYTGGARRGLGAGRGGPRGSVAPRQCCPHRPKTNSIVWFRISPGSGVIELMLSALRFNPIRITTYYLLTSNVIGGALSAGPVPASPEAFGVRTGPLDTVVLAEIGAPSAVALDELCAGLRPPCAEGARVREIVDEDVSGRGQLLRREAIAIN